jgi:tRNA nucleotidyltransferase (CCA-adding enzyme)
MIMTTKHRNILAVAAVFSTAFLFWGCGPKTERTTAKEFIESYSQAYREGDAKAILKMRAGTGLLEKMEINDALKQQIRDFNLGQEKEELEKSLKEDNMWTQAWKNTEYQSELDHGDHIHVEVKVQGFPSAVVLVRDGKFLRIHPRPSWFNCPPEDAR